MQLQQLLQNPQQFKAQFDNFARNFQQGGQNPQQVVQQLLNSGQMSQSQFNQLRNIANQITGLRF